jgi:hypothetical protein
LGHFRYSRHFLVLSFFAAVLAAPVARPRLGIALTFGMYGALHSLALMVSSRARLEPTAKFLFVVCAAVLSASSAAMTLYGARFLEWAPSTASPALLLAMSSGIGALTYAWLIRRFWIAELQYGAIAAIGVVCVAASLLVLATEALPRTSNGLWIAVPWWFAFSAGLRFCDRKSMKIENRSRSEI